MSLEVHCPALSCVEALEDIGTFAFHLKSMLEGNRVDVPDPTTSLSPTAPRLLLDFGKMFQKRRVSSPAPVTILEPQGLIER